MDGNSSTENPSTALPHTLPVDASFGWILASEEANGQSQESLSLFASQNQNVQGTLQGLGEILQRASESLQVPVERVQEPNENVQNPSGSPQGLPENSQKPLISLQKTNENIQNPLESPQGPPDNSQKLLISLQEPAENLHRPALRLMEPVDNLCSLSDKCKETDKNCKDPEENIHPRLDVDQKAPEMLMLSAGNPEEEQHVLILYLHHPQSGGTEPGSVSPSFGPSLEGEQPSMSEDQNVEAPAFSSGSQPPKNPTELQLIGVSPEFTQIKNPSELNPLEGSLEFNLPGDHQEFQPSGRCPESGDSTENHPPSNTPPTGNDQENFSKASLSSPSPEGAHAPSGEPQLCGFLLKLGGPLKTWKQRWFCYDERRNQLLYYRRPQDLTPLGQVGLNHATFSPMLEVDSRHSFFIHTPKRTFTLKVRGSYLIHRGFSTSSYLN